jgi:DNA ligase (NAD+)
MSAKAEDIGNIEGFGEIMAKSVVSYFALNSNKELISEFIKYGLNMKALENDSNFDNRFENLTFVLTGTLDKFTRPKATEIIENYNGKVSSSISKKTSYVVAGESPGSKVDKAKKIGVKILSEQEFLKMI